MAIREAKLSGSSQYEISEYVFCVCAEKVILLHELSKEQKE